MTIKQSKVIQAAISQLGYCESPPDSNKQMFGEWYGMNGCAWCAIFVSWCFDQAGVPLGKIDSVKGIHYCPSALNYFKKAGGQITTEPQPGDIVFFDWEKDGKVDHVGIFLQARASAPGTFISIEGNTALGDDSNGGKVMIRVRNYSVAVFVHPNILND